ncbi:MAG: hypothetical protein ABIO10_02885 [Ferruginibacter sp.]
MKNIFLGLRYFMFLLRNTSIVNDCIKQIIEITTASPYRLFLIDIKASAMAKTTKNITVIICDMTYSLLLPFNIDTNLDIFELSSLVNWFVIYFT